MNVTNHERDIISSVYKFFMRATVAARSKSRIVLREQHHFLLLLRNRRVYRGAAYELPEQIR
jgi:hypothetical protein